MPPDIHEPIHFGLFTAAFTLASMVAALALFMHLRKVSGGRASACAALLLVALALALTCFVVLDARRHIDALLASYPKLSACDKEESRHDGYGEARATAGLALRGAPFVLLLATFVAARNLRRPAWLMWASVPWALFAAAAYLYLQPLPGRRLWPTRCALYGDRDAILNGAGREEVRQGCGRLADRLKDPRGLGYALGGESQQAVLPELPELKKKCLADLLQWTRNSSPDEISRADLLGSPFVTPEDVPAVTKFLDEFKPRKPWDLDAGDEDP